MKHDLMMILAALVAGPCPCLVAATSPAYAFTPLAVDGGGHASASTDYTQIAGSFGGIAETAATSTAYAGRHAYVGALPELGIIQFVEDRTTIARSDSGVNLHVTRDGDEDSPIAVPFTTEGGSPSPDDVLLPGSGEVVFADVTASSVPLALALNRHVDDGVDTSFTVRLGLPTGEAELGAPRASRIFVTSVVRDDGRTHPLIISTPPALTVAGDSWVYEVVVDVSGLQLPHSLQTQFDLDWTLWSPQPGMRLERTSATTARVIWDPASGADDHHSVHVQVIDRLTGLSDWQDLLIFVARAPQGNG